MPDDFSADITTTGLLTLQPPGGGFLGNYGLATGNIETSGDRDWFAVTLQAGTTYAIDVVGGHDPGKLGNPAIMGLFDSTGNIIPDTSRENGAEGLGARLAFTPSSTGTYFAAVGTHEPDPVIWWDTSNTGTYTISVTDNWDDAASSTATVAAFEGFRPYRGGMIDWAGDVDWIAIELMAGESYEIRTGGYGRLNIDLRGVYDPSGTYVPETRNENGRQYGAETTFTAAETGTHYIAVTGAPGQAGNYWILADKVLSDYENVPGQTPSIAVGETHRGNIHDNKDRDWIAVELQAGQSYKVIMDNYGGELEFGIIHSIRDAAGNRFENTSFRDEFYPRDTPVVEFTAPTTGVYYLDVTGFASNAHPTNNTYDLKVIPDSGYTDDTSTSARVFVGGDVRGNLEYRGDVDWIAVDLQAGETYQVQMRGKDSDGGTLLNPYIYSIRDASGDHIARSSDDNSGTGRDAQVYFTAPTTGTYYIDARHSGNDGHHGGSGYTVSVDRVPDDYSGGTNTTGMIAPGGTAMGEIGAPGDVDWFATTLTAGNTYRVDMTGTGAMPLPQPALAGIYDAAGQLLAGTDTNPGDRLKFTAAADGTFYIAAAGQRSYQGDYSLELTMLQELPGTSGDDWLSLPSGLGLDDVAPVDGGEGIDMLSFADLVHGVDVRLWAGEVRGHGGEMGQLSISGIENVTGTSHADVFRGELPSPEGRLMRGLGGDDVFFAGGSAATTYAGGGGRDTLNYAHASDGISASLLQGRGWMGDAAGDRFSSMQKLVGSAFDDFLWGDHENNHLFGGMGNDVIEGNGGDDYILAGLGSDTIVFSGNQADYTITRNGIRTEVIDSVAGRDGHDVIGHGEILRFADGDLLL